MITVVGDSFMVTRRYEGGNHWLPCNRALPPLPSTGVASWLPCHSVVISSPTKPLQWHHCKKCPFQPVRTMQHCVLPLTVKRAQDSAEWPPPWRTRTIGPTEPAKYTLKMCTQLRIYLRSHNYVTTHTSEHTCRCLHTTTSTHTPTHTHTHTHILTHTHPHKQTNQRVIM